MKERPILFTGPMVRAILAGRKTQTRRVIKPQPMPSEEVIFDTLTHDVVYIGDEANFIVPCPYGVPGDRLWVRETWQCGMAATPSGYGLRVRIGKAELGDVVRYRAEGDNYVPSMPWRSPRFMPRWASRITLEVLSVRVQRVQEISDFDAFQEGVEAVEADTDDGHCLSFTAGFRSVWDHINAKRGFGWSVNPWVWVVEFRRVE